MHTYHVTHVAIRAFYTPSVPQKICSMGCSVRNDLLVQLDPHEMNKGG
jgi:hypothetical protein